MRQQKIFCVGLGKTGTTTFGACMQELGFRHLTGPYLSGAYLAKRRMPAALIELARDFQSFDDYPWPLVYQELHEEFPNARFVLTRRTNTEVWLESMRKHHDRYGPTETWELVFGARDPHSTPDPFVEFYERHNDAVRRFFADKPGRFSELCWEEGDGWDELFSSVGIARDSRPDAAPLRASNDSSQVDDERILGRLAKRGQLPHALWYASTKSADHEKALGYLDHEVINTGIEPCRRFSFPKRVLRSLRRRVKNRFD
ncbi:sulfotransferase [Salinisphaera orenii]|uniref:sulfotransferase n=1 Tax=Salinisphaera orenii TaxID=856731 RepID=UPI0011CD7637|nr:sulfotransferase [Salinisphaera halophila]